MSNDKESMLEAEEAKLEIMKSRINVLEKELETGLRRNRILHRLKDIVQMIPPTDRKQKFREAVEIVAMKAELKKKLPRGRQSSETDKKQDEEYGKQLSSDTAADIFQYLWFFLSPPEEVVTQIDAEELINDLFLEELVTYLKHRTRNTKWDIPTKIQKNRVKYSKEDLRNCNHGTISEASAKALLLADGDFLVRSLRRSEPFVEYLITVRWGGNPFTIPVIKKDGSFFLPGAEAELTFLSTTLLLEHYIQTQQQLSMPDGSSPTLIRPVPVKKKTHLNPSKKKIQESLERIDECFHGAITRESASALLQKDGDFLVREAKLGMERLELLSVRWAGTCRHIAFRKDLRGNVLLEDSSRKFRNTMALLHHYVQTQQEVFRSARLINPIPVMSSTSFSYEDEQSFRIGEGESNEDGVKRIWLEILDEHKRPVQALPDATKQVGSNNINGGRPTVRAAESTVGQMSAEMLRPHIPNTETARRRGERTSAETIPRLTRQGPLQLHPATTSARTGRNQRLSRNHGTIDPLLSTQNTAPPNPARSRTAEQQRFILAEMQAAARLEAAERAMYIPARTVDEWPSIEDVVMRARRVREFRARLEAENRSGSRQRPFSWKDIASDSDSESDMTVSEEEGSRRINGNSKITQSRYAEILRAIVNETQRAIFEDEDERDNSPLTGSEADVPRPRRNMHIYENIYEKPRKH